MLHHLPDAFHGEALLDLGGRVGGARDLHRVVQDDGGAPGAPPVVVHHQVVGDAEEPGLDGHAARSERADGLDGADEDLGGEVLAQVTAARSRGDVARDAVVELFVETGEYLGVGPGPVGAGGAHGGVLLARCVSEGWRCRVYHSLFRVHLVSTPFRAPPTALPAIPCT